MKPNQKAALKLILATLDASRDVFKHYKIDRVLEALTVEARELAAKEGVINDLGIVHAWGRTFIVPKRFKFVAVDGNMHVYAYEQRPDWMPEADLWAYSEGDFERIGDLETPIVDCHNALREVNFG